MGKEGGDLGYKDLGVEGVCVYAVGGKEGDSMKSVNEGEGPIDV